MRFIQDFKILWEFCLNPVGNSKYPTGKSFILWEKLLKYIT